MNIEEAKLIPVHLIKSMFGKIEIKEIAAGNAIDYVCAYLKATGEDYTQVDALRWINLIFAKRVGNSLQPKPDVIYPLSVWSVTRTDKLEDLALIRYAEQRGIPFEIANAHFEEVYVKNRNTGERMFTLGFRNEENGYALRNIYLKSCSEFNGVTFKRGEVAKPEAIHLFEGSFDYLSALIRFPEYITRHDSIILNSLSNLEAAWPYIIGYGYQTLYSWMDNDLQGKNTTKKIGSFVSKQPGLTHKPLNGLYVGHKDVNDWHNATYALPHTY